MLVCFDTNILIWGIRGIATSGQEHMVIRAKKYMLHLSNNNIKVLLPTPVIAEYLTRYDAESRKQQIEFLQERFRIAPFDLPAASMAAAIQNRRNLISGLKEEFGGNRGSIKTDCQIIAVATVAGADTIVSHDAALRKLAEDYLHAIDLPDISEQQELFEK